MAGNSGYPGGGGGGGGGPGYGGGGGGGGGYGGGGSLGGGHIGGGTIGGGHIAGPVLEYPPTPFGYGQEQGYGYGNIFLLAQLFGSYDKAQEFMGKLFKTNSPQDSDTYGQGAPSGGYGGGGGGGGGGQYGGGNNGNSGYGGESGGYGQQNGGGGYGGGGYGRDAAGSADTGTSILAGASMYDGPAAPTLDDRRRRRWSFSTNWSVFLRLPLFPTVPVTAHVSKVTKTKEISNVKLS